MSCKSFYRKFHSMNAAVAIARLEEEGSPILRAIARREPAKVVASKLGFRPRHVYNLREGECGTSWPHFILAAMHDATLRDLVGRWLGFTQSHDPRSQETLAQIRKLMATLPESGDVA
jgi:hypothetical protein